MKMRTCRRFSALLLAVLMLLGLQMTAFAADSTVVFKGAEEGFAFQPGSQYTATDLFDNFKGVMPGDRLTQMVSIRNEAADCNYIKLYMKVVVEEQEPAVLDFLSRLTMHIYNGSELIYSAAPDESGALVNYVLLGTLHRGEGLNLRVELDVPMDLGNEFASFTGEVDWVFLAECIELEKLTVHKVWEDNGFPERPQSVMVHLLRDGVKQAEAELKEENQWTFTWEDLDDRHQWTVEEIVPEGYTATYVTEDNNVFIINHMDYEPPVPPESTELTVKKVWSDNYNNKGMRPEAVTVTLYKGNTAVEKVMLGKWNNWTHTWKDLDGDANWSVLETGIPKGYVPSYSVNGTVVTITNTATLIQTGQLNWPIPVLGGMGVLMLFFGFLMMRKKKETDNA